MGRGALPKPVAVAKRSRQSVAERDPSIPSASSAEGSTATPSTVDVSGAPPFASFCACMASARQTPVRDFHLLTRACPLLMAGMDIATDSAGAGQQVTEPEPLHSGASAATPAGAPAVTAADVKERLDEMFSGDTGAPVTSSKDGIIDELRQVHVPPPCTHAPSCSTPPAPSHPRSNATPPCSASSCLEPPRPAALRSASSRPIPHPATPRILLTSCPVPPCPNLGPITPNRLIPHHPTHPLEMALPLVPWPPPLSQMAVATAAGAAWNGLARGIGPDETKRGGLGSGGRGD